MQAFASSIGAGTPSNFVGREATNCRTQNEVNSYFGVDLRDGRHLLPDFYSLRNRNSTTHVLMNWVLEGSVDKIDWRELDRRIHIHDDGTIEDEDDVSRLRQKGSATTWGIDQDIYRQIGCTDGFRFFRIVQIGKNSSGSDNLALSGFELYGIGTKGQWP